MDTGRPSLARRLANARVAVDAAGAVRAWQRRTGEAGRVDVGGYPILLVADPATAGRVLDGSVPDVAERGRFYAEIARVIGRTSLVTASGEAHRRMRRCVEPGFRPDALRRYADVMGQVADELQASWVPGGELRLDAAMQQLTLTIATRTFLGTDAEGAARFMADTLDVMALGEKLFYRLVLPRRVAAVLWRLPWLPGNRRLTRAQRSIDAALSRLVADRRESGGSGTLLDLLLVQDLSPEELRDQLVTFVFAGHETTAQALTWALVLLARHPPAAERVRAEVADWLGDPPGRLPDADDVAHLPYTRAVFREALRLYPPAWFLSREAAADTEIGGCPVPAGAMVMTSPLATHRDPRHWPDPEAFQPERWLSGDYERAAYFPFGRGIRSCVGSSFATTEGVIALAVLVPRWSMTLPGPVRARATTTLRPARPVRVRLSRPVR